MTTHTETLQEKRRTLHEQLDALAKKTQPQAASHRFVFALLIAGFVLFGSLAATFYASAAQREKGIFHTVVDGAGQVQVNNFNK